MAAPLHHHLFYAPPDCIREGRIYLPPEESVHMVASLRLGRGSLIAVTDGEGKLLEALVDEACREGVVAAIVREQRVRRERVRVLLFQALIRPQRMDLVVEKCVELGASAIVPVLCARCTAGGRGARPRRWGKIAVEAMKQSLRLHLPEIRPVTAFEEALSEAGGLTGVMVAHEAGGTRLGPDDFRGLEGALGVFVGPEGGFTAGEKEALEGLGGRFFSLGRARLRSETAAVAAIAVIGQFLQDPGRN